MKLRISGIVEFGECMKDAHIQKSICTMSYSGELQVNKTHMYFNQVQPQMYVVRRLWGILVILGSNGELFRIEIPFEQEWCRRNKRTMKDFMINISYMS